MPAMGRTGRKHGARIGLVSLWEDQSRQNVVRVCCCDGAPGYVVAVVYTWHATELLLWRLGGRPSLTRRNHAIHPANARSSGLGGQLRARGRRLARRVSRRSSRCASRPICAYLGEYLGVARLSNMIALTFFSRHCLSMCASTNMTVQKAPETACTAIGLSRATICSVRATCPRSGRGAQAAECARGGGGQGVTGDDLR